MGSALLRAVPPAGEVYAPTSQQLDISSEMQVAEAFAEFGPELVINAAAYTNVDQAEIDRTTARAVNAAGPANLARACKRAGSSLIHLSTDYVFSGDGQRPYREIDATEPINLYGESKLAGERAITEILQEHLILRVSWVFSDTGNNFVKTMLGLCDRQELSVVNDQLGTPCAAADIAACIWQISDRAAQPPYQGVYHFCSQPVVSWCDFARTIFAQLQSVRPDVSIPQVKPISSNEYPTRARRPGNSVLDGSRLEKDFGFQAPDWQPALQDVIQLLASRGAF